MLLAFVKVHTSVGMLKGMMFMKFAIIFSGTELLIPQKSKMKKVSEIKLHLEVTGNNALRMYSF